MVLGGIRRLKTLLLTLIVVGGVGVAYGIDAPHWYNADKQQNMDIDSFPSLQKASPHELRHKTNVILVNFEQLTTHNAYIPDGIDATELTKSQIIDERKKIEEQRALDLMRQLGY